MTQETCDIALILRHEIAQRSNPEGFVQPERLLIRGPDLDNVLVFHIRDNRGLDFQ